MMQALVVGKRSFSISIQDHHKWIVRSEREPVFRISLPTPLVIPRILLLQQPYSPISSLSMRIILLNRLWRRLCRDYTEPFTIAPISKWGLLMEKELAVIP